MVVSGSVVVSGGCSRMRWALVPLMPKEEMPARRGRSSGGVQGRGWVSSAMLPVVQSMWGVGLSACRVAGSRWWAMAWIILMMPAMPAAAWVWPMLDLIEPSQSGLSGVWWRP